MGDLKISIKRLKPGIGDILMISPALLGLKEKFPFSAVDLSVRGTYAGSNNKNGAIPGTIKYLPYVAKILDSDINKNRNIDYDYDVDISGQAGETSYEKPLAKPPERVDIFSNYLGVNPSNKIPYIHITTEEKAWARNYIRRLVKKDIDLSKKTIVLISINSNTLMRDLPVSTMLETAKLISKLSKDFIVIATSEKYESIKKEGFYFSVGLNIREYLSLVDVADVVITPDTGTLHVAGALNKKIISLWGSTHPESRTSYYKNVTNIWNNKLCKKCPCWYQASQCPYDYKCFKSIKPKTIVNNFKSLLSKEYESVVYRPNGVDILVNNMVKKDKHYNERILGLLDNIDYKIHYVNKTDNLLSFGKKDLVLYLG